MIPADNESQPNLEDTSITVGTEQVKNIFYSGLVLGLALPAIMNINPLDIIHYPQLSVVAGICFITGALANVYSVQESLSNPTSLLIECTALVVGLLIPPVGVGAGCSRAYSALLNSQLTSNHSEHQ